MLYLHVICLLIALLGLVLSGAHTLVVIGDVIPLQSDVLYFAFDTVTCCAYLCWLLSLLLGQELITGLTSDFLPSLPPPSPTLPTDVTSGCTPLLHSHILHFLMPCCAICCMFRLHTVVLSHTSHISIVVNA